MQHIVVIPQSICVISASGPDATYAYIIYAQTCLKSNLMKPHMKLALYVYMCIQILCQHLTSNKLQLLGYK